TAAVLVSGELLPGLRERAVHGIIRRLQHTKLPELHQFPDLGGPQHLQHVCEERGCPAPERLLQQGPWPANGCGTTVGLRPLCRLYGRTGLQHADMAWNG